MKQEKNKSRGKQVMVKGQIRWSLNTSAKIQNKLDARISFVGDI